MIKRTARAENRVPAGRNGFMEDAREVASSRRTRDQRRWRRKNEPCHRLRIGSMGGQPSYRYSPGWSWKKMAESQIPPKTIARASDGH